MNKKELKEYRNELQEEMPSDSKKANFFMLSLCIWSIVVPIILAIIFVDPMAFFVGFVVHCFVFSHD